MTDVRCAFCEGTAVPVRERREVRYGKRIVEVDDEFMRCAGCGESFYLPGQMEATDRRAAERAYNDGTPPLPFEIRRLRHALGYSQAESELLIGAGPKTWVRWERGTVTPNETAGTLLRLLEAHEAVVTWLAEFRRVRAPGRVPVGWRPANTIRVSVGQPVTEARTSVVDIAWYRDRVSAPQRLRVRPTRDVPAVAIG